ncbi:stage III sporulation protein AG [Oceanobacillus sp. J11TS1]|uniref:stage III sporulation protein AG n=1 Tax=Oceanobacillus sp. J11TS1 TaxID=2807191 RepID=UPI001B0C3B69|nr:stage III sporulation protein AG [Oceanobacillus sp. J11TS1]GIO23168.1 stage III sporulation protein AG [Oceanobacillus sp. J11TS1]
MKNKLTSFLKQTNSNEQASGQEKKQPSKKIGFIIILGLIGILFMVISNFMKPQQDTQPVPYEDTQIEISEEAASQSMNGEVKELENELGDQLAAMLNKMDGVSETEVMINLEATSEQVYEKNRTTGQQTTDETDRNGGTRVVQDQTDDHQVVLYRQGDQETPLLVQTKQPEVRGVFIVAQGIESQSTKSQVIEAVSRVLDVPSHKISVMPKN